MKSICLILSVFLTARFNPLFAQSADDERSGELWRDSRDTMLEVVELEETRRDLPRSKWFARDQKDLDHEIGRLLDEVLTVLEVSDLTEKRDAYISMGRRIDARREEIRHLREESLSAPADKSPLEFYKKTRENYAEEIEAIETDIENLIDQQEELVGDLADEYAEMGLELSTEQVRFYLSSVSGEDVMALSSVFHNVKVLNGQLEQLMRDTPNDPEAARRYYGIHVTLIRTMKHAHEATLDKLDNRYLERLDDLEAQNEELRKETQRLIRFAEDDQKGLLEASLRTQNVTKNALDLYREHLRGVRDRVYESGKALQSRYEVAQNAYNTIRISALLASEMQAVVRDLNALRDMHLPDMVPLNDEALQEKFTEITRELRGE